MIEIKIEQATKSVEICGIEGADTLLLSLLQTAARMLEGFGYKVSGLPARKGRK